jgi:hypothetical protein
MAMNADFNTVIAVNEKERRDLFLGAATRLGTAMQMSSSAAGAGNARGTNDGIGGTSAAATACLRVELRSNSVTHLRSIVALRPCAKATAAIDTPGRMHSWITDALNSALCRRRRRRPVRSTA